jgi:hypothetical protein
MAAMPRSWGCWLETEPAPEHSSRDMIKRHLRSSQAANGTSETVSHVLETSSLRNEDSRLIVRRAAAKAASAGLNACRLPDHWPICQRDMASLGWII